MQENQVLKKVIPGNRDVMVTRHKVFNLGGNMNLFNKENKNEKKQIWMYAVILFTGAFIILLLTAYSQVKFQNNISEYQSKLSTEQKEKISAATNLNSAVQENKRLNTELDSMKSKLLESEQKLAGEEEKNTELATKYSSSISNSDLLMIAFEYFNKEDYINCAVTLKYNVATQYLSPKALQSYSDLVAEAYPKASKELYIEGYKDYKKKNYEQAVISLNRAIDLSQKTEYYLDDSYYYLAKSYYKLSAYEEAKKIINTFIVSYPNSSFIDDMKALLQEMA